jgi:hypothetical protein
MSRSIEGADGNRASAVASVVFGFCLLFLGFLAGALVMAAGVYPAQEVKQAYQGGSALFQTMTSYNDPLKTDFWRTARSGQRGVTIHEQDAAFEGLTVYTSGHDQRAFLIDMSGRVLHEWALPFSAFWDKDLSSVRRPWPDTHIFIEKAHMFPNGDLLATYASAGDSPYGYGLVKMDRDGHVIWKYLGRTHHDFDIDAQGNVFVLTQEVMKDDIPGFAYLEAPRMEDFVVKLSPDGKELGKVRLLPAVARSGYGRLLSLVPLYSKDTGGDYLHTNSVSVVEQPTPQMPGVKPGHLIVSLREINTVAVLDFDSGEIVWAMAGDWIRQHDPDLLANGNILMFDNEGNLAEGNASRVIEVDPASRQIVWSYAGTADHPFQSIIRSSQSRLPNGNTLIVESDGGRLLEVTADGRIVWEFVNPVRKGPKGDRIPIIMWVQRVAPSYLDEEFRSQLSVS